jgi:glycosyltransferase involved in cell wall biosynthesis
LNPNLGGVSEGIRNTIPALEKLELRNEVVSCDSSCDLWIKNVPFPLHALGPGRFRLAYSAQFQFWLDKNLSRFDCVIVHGLWQWHVQATIRSFKKLKSNSQGAGRYPLLFIMPHGMLDPWFQRDKTRRLKAIRNSIYWWLFERQAVNSADALLFTCEEEILLARTTFRGYRPKREINIGYGIAEPPVFDPRMHDAFQAKCLELGNNPYLLFLGRIHPKKGVDLLIRAYAEVLKNDKLKTTFPHLVIAGPGWDTSYGRQMRHLIHIANAEVPSENCKLKTVNQPRIHAIGMLEGDSKWGAFHGCEAFILPSHQENFGIAVVEALACAKPVLISNKVNIWREIQKYKAGIVEQDNFIGTKKLLHSFLCDQQKNSLKLKAKKCNNKKDYNPSLECFKREFCVFEMATKINKIIRKYRQCE